MGEWLGCGLLPAAFENERDPWSLEKDHSQFPLFGQEGEPASSQLGKSGAFAQHEWSTCLLDVYFVGVGRQSELEKESAVCLGKVWPRKRRRFTVNQGVRQATPSRVSFANFHRNAAVEIEGCGDQPEERGPHERPAAGLCE